MSTRIQSRRIVPNNETPDHTYYHDKPGIKYKIYLPRMHGFSVDDEGDLRIIPAENEIIRFPKNFIPTTFETTADNNGFPTITLNVTEWNRLVENYP